jgi:hypothetical protein
MIASILGVNVSSTVAKKRLAAARASTCLAPSPCFWPAMACPPGWSLDARCEFRMKCAGIAEEVGQPPAVRDVPGGSDQQPSLAQRGQFGSDDLRSDPGLLSRR